MMFVESMLETARERLVTIADDAKLIDAAKILATKADLVMVCDSTGALTGVITNTDIVRQISNCTGATCMCPVSAVMIRDVVLCQGSDQLQDVSERMRARHLRNIPVVDESNRPLGVLTARAVLRVLLGELEGEEDQLIDYVKGLGYR